MIQGGDINSKDAPLDAHLGDGDLDYTIPAEFVYPKYFHKRGMLCAARTPDEENPEKASSATQFYIVTGKFFTEMELDKMTKEKGIEFTPEQKKPICWKAERLIWTATIRCSERLYRV